MIAARLALALIVPIAPIAPIALGALACTTEQQTVAPGAMLADASAVADASRARGNSPAPDGALQGASASDAGPPADAGALDVRVDAGIEPVGAAPVAEAGPKMGASALGKSTPFDRILVKPKATGDAEALKALVARVEKSTGHKLALTRRTAGKWLLLQFVPTAKGRDSGDQTKLVEVLKGMDELASVEGDRLMKLKQP